MVTKRFKCPSCGEIAAFSATPGEELVVTCPSCKMSGKIRFPAEHDASYAIEVSHLKKVYGDLIAVNDISFQVRKGEIFAFLGPNGAGKTTTVEIIESIREPTAGAVTLLEQKSIPGSIRSKSASVSCRRSSIPLNGSPFGRLWSTSLACIRSGQTSMQSSTP